MLNRLPETITTYTNLSKSTVSSLIREMKVDKLDFTALMSKMTSFSAGSDFAAQRITPLSTLNREVLVELFRDSFLRISNFYNAANTVGLALNSMVDVLSSEISKVEKDLYNLQIFIDNYEFLSGKDDLYNSNYLENFDNFTNNYTADGLDFSIPDKDGVSFDKFGNCFIDNHNGTLTMGKRFTSKNVLNNIKSMKIYSNYNNYTTTSTSFENTINDNLLDSWSVTVKSPIVLTSKISDYDKYITYNQQNINGARTVVEVDFDNQIEIDTIRFNPNYGSGLQLLQVTVFTPTAPNVPVSYANILNSPRVTDRTLDISFTKRAVNKIIFIFNQSTYSRGKSVPITSELNSKLVSSFVSDKIAEKRNSYSLIQDVVYWFFRQKNTIKGISNNKNITDSYYSYRFPVDIDTYSKMISDEIFRASNLDLEDRSLMNASPIFVDLFYTMMSHMNNDNFETYSNYYVESNSIKKGQASLGYPGFIPTNNTDSMENQKFQNYENIRINGTTKDVVRKLILNESSDLYEYSFSISSIDFLETISNDIKKACFVSRKIPVEGQVLAVKALIDLDKDYISLQDLGLDISSATSYELSVSNTELPTNESDWTPIMFNGIDSVTAEVANISNVQYSYNLRFKAKSGSVELYKNGVLINPTKYAYSQVSNAITLLDSGIYNANDIYCVSYDIDTVNSNPFEINLINNNIYKDSVKRFYNENGSGENFMKTDSSAKLILRYNPYVSPSAIENATYSSTIGTVFNTTSNISEYSPIKIRLSDGSYAINITNYTNKSEKVSFYDTNLTLFIHNGKNIIFNKVINSPINIDYEYVPYNLRFRLIMRKTIPTVSAVGKISAILMKMKSLKFDNYYNRLNKSKL